MKYIGLRKGLKKKNDTGDFPDGPLVQNLSSNAGDTGLNDSWSGN